jgi:hypothetical protein
MKKILSTVVVGLVVVAGSLAYGAVPEMRVTVSDSSGHAAYKGATDSNGSFATGTLQPGQYVVQFNAKRNNVEGNNYALVVSAGTKKVVASAVAGEKFAGGGVAMRIEVPGGAHMVGLVASDLRTMMKNGKLLVWIPQRLGSHLPAHWAEADSSDAKIAQTAYSLSFKNLQDKQAQGVGLR